MSVWAMGRQIHRLICGNHLSRTKPGFMSLTRNVLKAFTSRSSLWRPSGISPADIFQPQPWKTTRNITNVRCQRLFVINLGFKSAQMSIKAADGLKKTLSGVQQWTPTLSHSFSSKRYSIKRSKTWTKPTRSGMNPNTTNFDLKQKTEY